MPLAYNTSSIARSRRRNSSGRPGCDVRKTFATSSSDKTWGNNRSAFGGGHIACGIIGAYFFEHEKSEESAQRRQFTAYGRRRVSAFAPQRNDEASHVRVGRLQQSLATADEGRKGRDIRAIFGDRSRRAPAFEQHHLTKCRNFRCRRRRCGASVTNDRFRKTTSRRSIGDFRPWSAVLRAIYFSNRTLCTRCLRTKYNA